MVCRSRLSSLSLSASGSAASRSALAEQLERDGGVFQAAGRVEPRPEAKAHSPGVDGSGRPPATSSSAASPGRGALRRRPRPIAVSTRFSSTSGTTSAMVPTATRSVYGRSASGRSTSSSPGLFEESVRQLERHPDAGEMAARIRRPAWE